MSHASDFDVETNLITLTRHSIHDQAKHESAKGDMTLLLTSIQLGCKFVGNAVRKAGLANLTGLAGNTNVQGEAQKKLDVIANEIFINALKSSGKTAILVSEEDEEAIFVEEPLKGKYIVCFDPLDGSSNIECAVSIGTIFGIWRLADHAKGEISDVLKPGSEMIAAGYACYGSSTVLVLSTGAEVNGYTLDPSLGEFILTHPSIKLPSKGKIYSINEGNASKWDQATKEYIDSVKFTKSPYSCRYIGSMVADVHRTLLYGGIFGYPGDKSAANGKLRILYEVFPMAYLTEKAGGKATTGRQRVLDIVPKSIHERCPVWLGSKEDVEQVETFYKKMDEKKD
jgi:fructose-1,6-bisphosphatase I